MQKSEKYKNLYVNSVFGIQFYCKNDNKKLKYCLQKKDKSMKVIKVESSISLVGNLQVPVF